MPGYNIFFLARARKPPKALATPGGGGPGPGVNKDSYLVLDTLPDEYDSRVKAMEVEEKPKEEYGDVGGLDKQIQEMMEAVVLPIGHGPGEGGRGGPGGGAC